MVSKSVVLQLHRHAIAERVSGFAKRFFCAARTPETDTRPIDLDEQGKPSTRQRAGRLGKTTVLGLMCAVGASQAALANQCTEYDLESFTLPAPFTSPTSCTTGIWFDNNPVFYVGEPDSLCFESGGQGTATDNTTGSTTDGTILGVQAGPGNDFLPAVQFSATVTPNTDYDLNFANMIWARSDFPTVDYRGAVRVYVNGVLHDTVLGTPGLGFAVWEDYSSVINTGANTTMNFELHIKRGSDNLGNDYMFDDINFRTVGNQFCGVDTDFGDAPVSGSSPDTAGTNAYGEASHTIMSGIYLGAGVPDAETANQPNGTATGDDSDGQNDDDGITIPQLTQGQSTTITASVSGTGGFLQGWIDWNGNGAFGAGEQVASNLADGNGDGVITFSVTPPAATVINPTFARFRWSTTANLDSATPATDGEVEDYRVTIDSSCSTAVTTAADSGAGSLRNAIACANSDPAKDDITFNIAGGGAHTITPLTPLPAITDDGVSIDGSTQPSASCGMTRNAAGAITDRTILISLDGTSVGADGDGLSIGTADGVTIKGLSVGNFDRYGVRADDSTNTTIICNHIGLAADGIALAGNSDKGLFINGVTGGDIGDGTISGMNVIGGNDNDGIWFDRTIDDVIVDTNYIGIAADGNTAVGNGRGYTGAGVSFSGYDATIVSDGEIIRNNVIASNGFDIGGFYGTVNNLLVENNYLGTDATGLLDRSDQYYIIIAESNQGWIIRDNVISGADQGSALELYDMSNMTIQGNKIGVGSDGTTVIGNGFWGVRLSGGADNLIGGLGAGEGNIIAHSSQDFANGYSGILAQNGTTGQALGNTIYGTRSSGIDVNSNATRFSARQNSIYDNLGLGIDLGTKNVTSNDAGDADTGPNGLINFPVINAVTADGATALNYDINLDAPANANGYRVEFFSNRVADPSTHGEGEVYLGFIDVSHAGGDLNFTGTLAAGTTVAAGDIISTTTTAKTASGFDVTSEFSGVETVLATPNTAIPVPITSCGNLLMGEFKGTFGTLSSGLRDLQSTPNLPYRYNGVDNNDSALYAVTSQVYSTNLHPSGLVWNNLMGHTTGAPDDAYLAVNGSTTEGIFYQETFALPASGTYQVALWAINAITEVDIDDPDLGIRIIRVADSTTVFQTSTGRIAETGNSFTGPENWTQAVANFDTTLGGEYRLEVYNVSLDINGNDFAIDDISIAPVNEASCPKDYTDAPLSGTSYGSASHQPTTWLTLGTTVTSETSDFDSANADGDVDDGVTFPTLTQGDSADIPVTVTQANGNDGYLQGWIDWNGNGNFADPGEQIALNVQSATAGTSVITVNVNVPADASISQTFARFRWSTTSELDATTAATASDGEVEDYAVTIETLAPIDVAAVSEVCLIGDGNARLSGKPSLWWDVNSYPFPGNIEENNRSAVTSETVGGNALVFGPGVTGSKISVWHRLAGLEGTTAGEARALEDYVQVSFTMNSDFTGFLQNWTTYTNTVANVDASVAVDIATQPDFSDAVNFFDGAQPTSPGNRFAHSVGSGRQILRRGETYYVRFYFYGAGNQNTEFDSLGLDFGSCMDFGDGTIDTAASHDQTAPLYLGTTVDAEEAAAANDNAVGDDNAGADDEDGVTFPTLTQGFSANIPVTVAQASGNDGYLQGWIDWNGNGNFADPGEQIALNVQSATAGTSVINVGVNVPSNATGSATFARFRWSTTSGLNSTTAASDGEVEDYQVSIGSHTVAAVGLGNCSTGTAPWTVEWIDRAASNYSSPPGGSTPQVAVSTPKLAGVWSDPPSGSSWITYNFLGPNNGLGDHADADYDGNLNEGAAVNPTPVGTSDFVALRYRLNVNLADPAGVVLEGLGSFDNGVYSITINGTPNGSSLSSFNALHPVQLSAGWVSGNNEVIVDVASGPDLVGLLIGDCVITRRDYSDAIADGGNAPNGTAGTAAYGEASHVIVSGVQMGANVTGEAGAVADADDASDDGVSFPALVVGGTGTINVSTAGSGGYLQAWIDWDGSGAFDDPVEQIATDLQDFGSGTISIPVTVPSYATTNPTFARFRWSTDFSIGPSGAAPDGEVEDYRISFGASGSALAGRVFLDNGSGATAYDAVKGGLEPDSTRASISLFDGSSALLATVPVNGDGTWSYVLPPSYTGAVTVMATPEPGVITVSEQTAGLPSLSNSNPHDGTFTFTPVAGTSYGALDIGLLALPTLTQDQSTNIVPGQIVALSHRYEATGPGSVTFALTDIVDNPAGTFTSAIYRDVNCDGTLDNFVSAAINVVAGESVCLAVRTQVGAGAGPGASLSYGLTANTAFTGTSLVTALRNNDRIGSGGDELLLRKLVTNLSIPGATEGTSNIGNIGDTLQYRIVFTNPGSAPANDILVNDATPAYTALAGPIAPEVTVAPGITCSLQVPAAGNMLGYVGPLQWRCPGAFPPGAQGSVTFQVQISP